VRQSLSFKSSIDKHDYSRERQLFGKTYKDIQNADLLRLSGQHNMITSQAAIMNQSAQQLPIRRRIVSKLEPQGSLQSYAGALGLTRELSGERISVRRPL